jgi:hypothetical protein
MRASLGIRTPGTIRPGAERAVYLKSVTVYSGVGVVCSCIAGGGGGF